MNAKTTFDQLRNLARSKRDQDLEFIKKTYKDRLAQIDTMERELLSSTPSVKPERKQRNAVQSQVIASIPQNEPFTFDELMSILAKANVTATIGYVRQVVRRMVKRGEMKEVINRQSRKIKKYALPHVDAEEPLPPLGETVKGVLNAANAPMRPVEIAVQMIENGNPIEGEDPTAAVNQILRVLREHPDKFREVDEGYWKTNSHSV